MESSKPYIISEPLLRLEAELNARSQRQDTHFSIMVEPKNDGYFIRAHKTVYAVQPVTVDPVRLEVDQKMAILDGLTEAMNLAAWELDRVMVEEGISSGGKRDAVH